MMPDSILKNQEVLMRIETLCKNAMEQIEYLTNRTATKNSQLIFKVLRDDILSLAKKASKSIIPKKIHSIKKIEAQIKQILNDNSLDLIQQKMTALELEEELACQEKALFKSKRLHLAARHNS
jgi:hypothetical protein